MVVAAPECYRNRALTQSVLAHAALTLALLGVLDRLVPLRKVGSKHSYMLSSKLLSYALPI